MIRDLLLGLRLAAGGGRMSGQALVRLVMSTVGVALVVSILLAAASVGNVVSERAARAAANGVVVGGPGTGDVLLLKKWFVETRDGFVGAKSVAATGPDAPVPPGLDRIPAPGELMISPALKERLGTDSGHSLLAQVPGTVVGEIGKPGLIDASDLTVYIGITVEHLRQAPEISEVTAFGLPAPGLQLDATLTMLLAPVLVSLLLPLGIFVGTASRMGAAQRERRLAALRLLGVDARQVRRIAAAESLLGAAAGLVVGAALFVLLRPLIGKLDFFGTTLFAEDFVPSPVLAVVIALLVPGLAVGVAIFGLRRTIIEPLGVVRQSKPVRRRMGWRWGVTGLGVLLVVTTQFSEPRQTTTLAGLVLTTGSALLLVGVAVLLPWAVEKLVGGMRGATPALQFAVRRLQLDSGTASRVVSGLVVVLAGTIMIQTVFVSLEQTRPEGSRWKPPQAVAAEVFVSGDESLEQALARVRGVDGVNRIGVLRETGLRASGPAAHDYMWAVIGDCAALATQAAIGSCADGDVFLVGDRKPSPGPLNFVGYQRGEEIVGDEQWTVPPSLRTIPADQALWLREGELLITPGALGGVEPPQPMAVISVIGPGDQNALFDRVAAAVAPLAWSVSLRPGDADSMWTASTNRQLETFRAILLTANLFVLAVASLSLLMLSIEQIVARRRPLAALSAAGVPLSVLVRGSLWQNTIPILVGVMLAVVAGIGLAVPTLRLAGIELSLDAGLLAIFSGAAVLAVLLVTALTFPLLRQATRLDGLRAE